jgi:hypothetical protein
LTAEGHGIELFFAEGMMCLRMDTKGKKMTQKLQFTFEPHKWHFVCITHEYRFLGSSELKLYIDFRHKYEFPVSYPKISEVNCFGSLIVVASYYLLHWSERKSEWKLSHGKVATSLWANEFSPFLS